MSECVIFDLDGTLVDSALVCADILTGMLAARGSMRTISPAQTKPFLSRGGTRMVAALLANECGDPELEIAEFRRRYAETATPPESLYPGVRAGLIALTAGGRRLAICSNKPQPLCDKVLADLDLADMFEVVVGWRAGFRAKPAIDLLDLTLLRLRLTAERCVYVGDSELDHAVAKAAGIPFHFVTYGYAELGWSARRLTRHDRFDHVVAAILDAEVRPRRRATGAR